MNTTLNICYFSILMITLTIAIWSWKHYKKTSERFFLWFLLYTFCHEVWGFSYVYFFENSNTFQYNLYILISFGFYFFWFYKILKKRKWIVFLLLSFFILRFIYETLTISPFLGVYVSSIFIGTLGVFILSISYFVELINSNSIVILKRSQKFWIVIGLLFFHVGFTYMFLLFEIFEYRINLYAESILFLNCIHYGCYIYSFLCFKDRQKVFKNSVQKKTFFRKSFGESCI